MPPWPRVTCQLRVRSAPTSKAISTVSAGQRAVRIRGSWVARIALGVVCFLWLVPSLGLLVTSALVLLEYRKEDPTIPIRFEHKMTVAEARLEVEAEGFTLSKVDESLPRQHILIFTVRR